MVRFFSLAIERGFLYSSSVLRILLDGFALNEDFLPICIGVDQISEAQHRAPVQGSNHGPDTVML